MDRTATTDTSSSSGAVSTPTRLPAAWGRYSELDSHTLADIRAAAPIAYLPWGALEWHGPHLPFGVDGIIAEAVAERTVQRTGGVLLPTSWWPTAALPTHDTLAVRVATLQLLLNDLFEALATAGWLVLVIINGHYTQGHELVLLHAAERALEHGLRVLPLPPMLLIDETMLDHAALWETSLMLALRPDLVHLDVLGTRPLAPDYSGVVGQDPRGTASAAMGRQALNMAVQFIARAVEGILAETTTTETLTAFYAQRHDFYLPFVERYDQGSLEEATRAWWHDLCLQYRKETDGEPTGEHA